MTDKRTLRTPIQTILYTCLLVVIIAVALKPTTAQAVSESDLTFTLNSDGKGYTVSACKESASGDAVIPATYKGLPVTRIGESAFSDCHIKSVIIPDGVTDIGNGAFLNCTGLKYLSISGSVTRIGDLAFFLCANLIDADIPNGVITIGKNAFENCSHLKSVSIPSSVTSIGNSAFAHCYELPHIYVHPDNPNYTSDNAGVLFNKDKTRLMQAPGAISGAYAIPDSVTAIDDYAFDYCNGLTRITLGKSLADLDGAVNVDGAVFNGCAGLQGIFVPADNSHFSSDSAGVLFNKDKTTLIKMPVARSGAYTIPDSVASIERFAFFLNNLNGIFVSENNPNFSSDSAGILFNKDKTVLIQAPCTISGTYVIPNSVTVIGDYAFEMCTELTGIIIPDSVTQIGDYVFTGCSKLNKRSYAGTQEQWDRIVINKNYNQKLVERIVCTGPIPSSSPTAAPSTASTTQSTVIPTTQPTTIPETQPATIPTTVPTSAPGSAPVDIPDNGGSIGMIVAIAAVVLLTGGSASAFMIFKKKTS